MNSDDLSLFAQVARAGSISRAAMDQGADQSTISRRIGLLEAELGVRLFHRSGRGVALTERGQQLLGYADQLSATLGDALRSMRDSAEQGPARLCIAAQPTIARMLFGRLQHALKARFPNTRVRFIEGLASQILGQLSDGEVDLAILYLPEHPGALQFDVLLNESIHLITPPDYLLPSDTLDVRALAEVPLILPSTHHGLRVLVESLASRYGFSANIAVECDGSISITKRLVMDGCGCTVLPLAAVSEEIAAGRLQSVRLQNPEIVRQIAMTWPKNRPVADGVWAVTQAIRQCVIAQVNGGAWPGAQLAPALQGGAG